MSYENKEKAISELKSEIDVVLSIKDDITQDEIDNFKEEFPMLTEGEIRDEISKLSQDENYVKEYSKKIDDIKEVKTEDALQELDDIKIYKIGDKFKEIDKLKENEEEIDDVKIFNIGNSIEESDEVKEYILGKKSENENIDLGNTIRFDGEKVKEAVLKYRNEEISSESKNSEDIEINDAILISAIKDVEESFGIDKLKIEDKIDVDEVKVMDEMVSPEQIEEEEEKYEEPEEPGRLPENIKVIRGEVRYNQLSIDWDWPYGVHKVLILYRNDKFPLKVNDSGAVKLTVEKKYGESVGQFTIRKVKEENYYFSVFPIIEKDGEVTYLEGKKRLVVSKAPSEVFYNIKVRRRLFGEIKSVSVIFSTSAAEANIPPTVLVAKRGNIPVFKSDGEEIYKIDYIKIDRDETAEVEIPLDVIKRDMYVKLFLEDEGNSSLFRIIPPHKKKLYFK